MNSSWQAEIAAGRTIIIDGGTGAALQERGVPVDPVCWHAMAAITHPADLVAVHVDFINAGARVITANTFATHRYVLEKAGYSDGYAHLMQASIAAARRARTETGTTVAIAGAMSCMPPAFDTRHYPAQAKLRAAYIEHAHTLADLGVDLIALEMIQDSRHGGWALDAALATGLPVWLGLSCRSHPISHELVCFDLPETRLESVMVNLLDRKPAAVNIMHTPMDTVADAVDSLRRLWPGPIGVYPEAGSFDAVNRVRTVATTPEEFAMAAKGWITRGAAIVGGCCGATAAHIAALADAIDR